MFAGFDSSYIHSAEKQIFDLFALCLKIAKEILSEVVCAYT